MPTVLVVDDNDEFREAVAEYLRGDGHVVIEAKHGQDARDFLARQREPCVIVLDLLMPIMGGLEVIEALEVSGRLKKHPVIVISAGNFIRADVPQARDLLRKPTDLPRLGRLVGALSIGSAPVA